MKGKEHTAIRSHGQVGRAGSHRLVERRLMCARRFLIRERVQGREHSSGFSKLVKIGGGGRAVTRLVVSDAAMRYCLARMLRNGGIIFTESIL
jgi:hypothetical protein